MSKDRSTILTALVLLLMVQSTRAGSATWNLNPTSGDWNTATNWTPATVPNGPADAATFAISNTPNVSISADTQVKGVTFDPSASGFTITAAPGFTLTVGDNGLINNSGIGQNFEAATQANGTINVVGRIDFTGNATAGAMNVFTQHASAVAGQGGAPTSFFDTSSAGSSTFLNKADNGPGGTINFFDTSSAADGTFTNEGGSATGFLGGSIAFWGNSTAGNGNFNNLSASEPNATGGGITFNDSASADHGTFTFNGASVSDASLFGNLQVGGSCNMANATFTLGGGIVSGALGVNATIGGTATCAEAVFTMTGGSANGATGGWLNLVAGTTSFPSCGNATFIANGGSSGGGGGTLFFLNSGGRAPDGGTARIELFGNGALDLSQLSKPLTTGSLEGNGVVFLGSTNLTIGTRNADTSFSGFIRDGGIAGGKRGSFTKIGTGRLILTGANTYTGSTTVESGILLVNNRTGSGTGRGDVQVSSGTFGGGGIVAGAVKVGTGSGTGAFLAPGKSGVKPGPLTIQNTLTLEADATYKVTLDSRIPIADKVTALGVTAGSALILFNDLGTAALPTGTIFTLLNNTSATPISGRFSNLADGAIVTVGSNKFQANYEGGDGNDLTLTVVP